MTISQVDLPHNLQTSIDEVLGQSDRTPAQQWQVIVRTLATYDTGPETYRRIWNDVFAEAAFSEQPIWVPDQETIDGSNLTRWMELAGQESFDDFFRWSVENRENFWQLAIDELGVQFESIPEKVLDDSQGTDRAVWLGGARLNIFESCFQAGNDEIAVISQQPGGAMERMTYGQLRALSNRIANGLINAGFQPGDAIAVVLPMTALSIPIYLGIVATGCAVVSIADSFAPPEIASRVRIGNAKAVFAYDVLMRGGKSLPLYDRVTEATEVPIITVASGDQLAVELRSQDLDFSEFLSDDDQFEPCMREAQDAINILFSSGTTGDPKAIPWDHLTPIKCASDGCLHQDIQNGDVVAWPTNLGWMMGPWLIFASLINRASIALYEDAPMGEGFGRFVQDAEVNMLGVVPTIVKAWRNSQCMEGLDWSAIHCFSSTGEASGAEDMFYLSSLAGMKPIIEYCGGTEIGGGYVTSTVVQPNFAAAFTTPAIGLDFVLLDEECAAADEGELFLIPPSIGLSSRLLNRDHHETYYAGAPKGPDGQVLRRHGDHMKRLPCGAWAAGGRVDDTMNLGGIKISSAEIERVLNMIDGVKETAAVAFSDGSGPEQLAVFTVAERQLDEAELLAKMNSAIKTGLNPLFKVVRVQIIDSLPRTASNKVMRRKLRDLL